MKISEELLDMIAEEYLETVERTGTQQTFYQFLSRWLTVNHSKRTIVSRDSLV